MKMQHYDSIQLTSFMLYTQTQCCDLRLCFGSDARHTCVVMSSVFSSVLYEIWCHHSEPCPMIRSREMWGHSSFPKWNINHNDFQNNQSAVQGRAVLGVHQHRLYTWIRKIMSLVFWFNLSVSFMLLQLDTLITMISASGTYVRVVLCSSRASHTFWKHLFKMWSF